MQHTSKMVMVPHDVYSGIMSKQEQTYSPLIGQLSNLDQEIQSILSNPNLSTDAKYQLYQQVFGRYQHLKQQQFPVQQFQTVPDVKIASGIQTEDLPIVEQNLIDGLPKPIRRKGKMLLNHLQANKSISWKPSGELKDKSGLPIEGSNITDLVHYVTRNRPTAKAPNGSNEFIALLEETNVPREAISGLEDKFMTPKTFGTDFSPLSTSTPKEIQDSLRSTNRKQTQNKLSTPKRKTGRHRIKPERFGNWVEQ